MIEFLEKICYVSFLLFLISIVITATIAFVTIMSHETSKLIKKRFKE